MDNTKVYESLPLPELKQEVQKSNIIQETAEQLVAEAPEAEAKALAKAEKKAKLEADAAEAEAKALAEAKEKAKLEADAAEAEAKALAEAEEKAKIEAAEAEAKALAEAEAKALAETEAIAIAEAEEKTKLEQAAEIDIQAEALEKVSLEVEKALPSDSDDDFENKAIAPTNGVNGHDED